MNKILGIIIAIGSLEAFSMSTVLYRSEDNSNWTLSDRSRLEFGFSSNQFAKDVGDVEGNLYEGTIDYTYFDKRPGYLEKKFDFSASLNDLGGKLFSLNEAYIQHKYSNFRLTLGRKIIDWSKIDSIWSLGHLNNRENFNFFTPKEEGLTGLGFGIDLSHGFSVNLFTSIIYQPELNPGNKIDKDAGTVECRSVWCKAPDSSTDVSGSETPIFYDIKYPDISDIVFRYSAGLNLAFENNGYKANAFWMRKPENNISISAEISIDVTDVGFTDTVFISVYPEVYYHDVMGINFSKQYKKLNGYVSAFSVTPNGSPDGNRKVYDYTGLQPEKRDEQYLGGGLQYTTNRFQVSADYLGRVSSFNQDEGDLLAEEPRWSQVMRLALKAHYKKFSFNADIKYDTISEDRLYYTTATYHHNKMWAGYLGAQIIGTSVDTASYWDEFVNNDAFFAGVKLRI